MQPVHRAEQRLVFLRILYIEDVEGVDGDMADARSERLEFRVG